MMRIAIAKQRRPAVPCRKEKRRVSFNSELSETFPQGANLLWTAAPVGENVPTYRCSHESSSRTNDILDVQVSSAE